MDFAVSTLVIDNRSEICHAGFAGDDVPRAVFPSVVGRHCHRGVFMGAKPNAVYLGDDAMDKKEVLALKYPVERGIITNWDDMEQVRKSSTHFNIKY